MLLRHLIIESTFRLKQGLMHYVYANYHELMACKHVFTTKNTLYGWIDHIGLTDIVNHTAIFS